MEIKRNGSQASVKPPEEYFTGTVRLDPLFQSPAPARANGNSCNVRTRRAHGMAYASAGPDFGRHRRLRPDAALGRPRSKKSAPGDVVFIAPGEKHWHGAGPTTAMTHIAIQEQVDGIQVEWLEKVSDEQYGSH